jgi:protein involved in polysaccharide export with SLBB domain
MTPQSIPVGGSRSVPATLILSLCCLALPGAALGQQAADSSVPGLQATRVALESLAQRAADSSSATQGARLSPAAIRARLTDGDFAPGDRILLVVEGEPQLPDRPERERAQQPRTIERALSDTFTVAAGRELMLPVIGPISLRGVLRAELEPYLRQEIARFVKDPVVHAKALVRVSVAGAVAKPGFYFVPADAALSDALTAAGGPTQDARLDKARVERVGKRVLEGKELRLAFAEGRTLDEMQLRSGDEFVVPGVPGHAYDHVRFWATLLSIPVAIYALAHAF